MNGEKFPWYEDEDLNNDEVTMPSKAIPACVIDDEEDDMDEDDEWEYCEESPFDEPYDTPQKIFEYLDRRIYKQTEAKKAAALLAYKTFGRGIRENVLFAGPSGCGKTFIWKTLQSIFPNRIAVMDASNLTMDGWSGGKKWGTLLSSPIFKTGKPCVLVLDEADKMFAPKFNSSHENVSLAVQGEGLKMIEGCTVAVKDDAGTYIVDTSKISFVFCGAFNQKAEEMAEKASGSRIGFGAGPVSEVKAYEKPLTEKELLAFGMLPELMGRLQKIINLERITEDDYLRMLDDTSSPVERIKELYDCEIALSDAKKREIAEQACELGLGVRGMENTIRQMVDEVMFEDPERRQFAF